MPRKYLEFPDYCIHGISLNNQLKCDSCRYENRNVPNNDLYDFRTVAISKPKKKDPFLEGKSLLDIAEENEDLSP